MFDNNGSVSSLKLCSLMRIPGEWWVEVEVVAGLLLMDEGLFRHTHHIMEHFIPELMLLLGFLLLLSNGGFQQ
jgi:hypothetical protein